MARFGENPQIFVPCNGKIADITHADTNKHTLNLATALSETRKIIKVHVEPRRIAGTGDIHFYPNEGTGSITGGTWSWGVADVVIKDGTNRLQYALTVASDDWDLYCWSYVVEA